MKQATFPSGSVAMVLGALCLGLLGCSPAPRTVEVVGRVTHNGRPVADALVVFLSNDPDDAPAWAKTDADGRYRTETFFSANDIALGTIPDRSYSVYIEKFIRIDTAPMMKKMASIAAEGGDVQRYIREQALHDVWPNGIPEDWPLDYVPGIMDVPVRLRDDQESLQKLTRLQRGISLLPLRYADAATSGFRVSVERSNEPQVFDFDLTGEIEQIKYREPHPQEAADDSPQNRQALHSSSAVSAR